MTTGRFYIDGKDAYAAYGVFVANNGYTGLISFPPYKELDKNDFEEENGIDVDLTSPAFSVREFAITFYSKDYWKTVDFIALISDGSYHEYNFAEAGCRLRLRLLSSPQKKIFKVMENFSMTFADDFPMKDYSHLAPEPGGIPKQTSYEIDGVPLSDYGVYLLDGSDGEIIKMPAVKKNLLIDLPGQSGAIYDGENVVFQKKDVALKCWMRSKNVSTMWQNLNALVYDLTKLTEKMDEEGYKFDDAGRTFYSETLEEEFPCYYNGLSATKFQLLSGGRAWLEFTLTLTFTSFVLDGVEYLLSTEAGELITTEDDFFIDLKDYAN